MNTKPQETIADFKQRIALLMRNREGGKRLHGWCCPSTGMVQGI